MSNIEKSKKVNKLSNNGTLSRYLALGVPVNKCQVTYVWIDGRQGLRSKSRTVNFSARKAADLPLWNFDGASTYQTPHNPTTTSSDVFLLPVALYDDPFRPAAGNSSLSTAKLALCETVLEDGRTATGGNTRAQCEKTMQRLLEKDDPWFGIEQEYYLLESKERTGKIGKLLGWPEDGSDADPPGPNYCGVGFGNVVGRDVVEAHYR